MRDMVHGPYQNPCATNQPSADFERKMQMVSEVASEENIPNLGKKAAKCNNTEWSAIVEEERPERP